jgi:hypothetical protein
MADKFKALVHYICWRSRNAPDKFGAVKLNKILWFADCEAFRRRGRTITGARYIKKPRGPVPVPIDLALSALEREGAIEISQHLTDHDYNQRRFKVRKEPNKDIFSRDELEIVNSFIDSILKEHTAESISELSHDQVWRLAKIDEDLPVSATLASKLAIPSDQDIAAALRRMGKVS